MHSLIERHILRRYWLILQSDNKFMFKRKLLINTAMVFCNFLRSSLLSNNSMFASARWSFSSSICFLWSSHLCCIAKAFSSATFTCITNIKIDLWIYHQIKMLIHHAISVFEQVWLLSWFYVVSQYNLIFRQLLLSIRWPK